MRALAETHQRFREMLVRMHGDVAGDVVKNIGLRQIIQLIGAADGDGGGEFAIAKAIKEKEGGNVAAHGLGLEAGQRAKKTVDVFEARYAVRIQAERSDAFQKMRIGVALPARHHALVELPPGLMVFFRIKLVGLRLRDVEFPIALGLLDKRRLGGGEAGRDGDRGRRADSYLLPKP